MDIKHYQMFFLHSFTWLYISSLAGYSDYFFTDFFLEGDQILSGCSYLLWEFKIFYFPINSVNFCLIYYAHLLGIYTLMVLCLQDGNTFFFMKCPSLSLVIIFIFILFGINVATPAFLYYVWTVHFLSSIHF